MFAAALLLSLIVVAVCAKFSSALGSNLTTTYSGSSAASWAVSCIPGCSECPECTSPDCSCGCTYFTTRTWLLYNIIFFRSL